MLYDVASKNNLPIRAFKWVRSRSEGHGPPLKLWEDAASYYHRFGFIKMYDDDDIEKIRERSNEIMTKWWDSLTEIKRSEFRTYVTSLDMDPPILGEVSSLDLEE